MMVPRQTTLERAFELAKSGKFTSLESIRAQLSAEGFEFARAQTTGATLTRQLRKLIDDADTDGKGPERCHPGL